VSEQSILRLDGLTRRFGDRVALSDVTFSVARGEYVAVLGPSGSGKTTLLRAIAGFDALDAGRIFLSGRDVTAMPAHERGIGFVFQNFALFPHLSVLDNVAFGLRNGAKRVPEPEVLHRAHEVIELVGLKGLEERGPDIGWSEAAGGVGAHACDPAETRSSRRAFGRSRRQFASTHARGATAHSRTARDSVLACDGKRDRSVGNGGPPDRS
jgi:ABC-type transporter Mla maintaining outer membrane lipid asymmetry ATPase subunit MlaF